MQLSGIEREKTGKKRVKSLLAERKLFDHA